MKPESKKLTEILEWCDLQNIEYILIGEDPEMLSREISSDVDLVVSQKSIQHIFGLMDSICGSCNVQRVQILQHEVTAYYFVVTWMEDIRHYLRLDICSDYFRNARLLLTADEMLVDRRKDEHTGFYVPATEKNLLYYLLKKVDKGSINATQFEYLVDNFKECTQSMLPELCRFWTPNQAAEIVQTLQHGNLDGFKEKIPELQKTLRSNSRPSTKSVCADAARVFRRVLNPTGVWIAIYGPDGSGKSSVINGLLPAMLPAFRKTSVTHFRPRLGLKNDGGTGVVEDPHGQPLRRPTTSILKLFYYTADYVAGFFLKVLPAKFRSTFIVFDRYYDDLIIDPRRYCYGGPVWLLKLMRPFIPEPDLVFCLDADPEILQARKKEVSFEECKRQREAYRALAEKLPNGHVIDASQPLEDVVRDVQGIVLNFMTDRTAKRMKRVGHEKHEETRKKVVNH